MLIYFILKNGTKRNNGRSLNLLASEVNSEFEEGACSFSSDGKTMYFTRCRTLPNAPAYAEIYVSQRAGAEWGAPQKCAILNDTLSSVAHPVLSPAGDYLYFVSDNARWAGEGWICGVSKFLWELQTFG